MDRGGSHPPGWLRIATSSHAIGGSQPRSWQPPSGVAEDRNCHALVGVLVVSGGSHPPGRLRIATVRPAPRHAPRDTRGSHPPGWLRIATYNTGRKNAPPTRVAATLRGG